MKKYAYILSIMIVLISPKNIFAKSINLKTECKNIKENVECKILIDSNNKIIKGTIRIAKILLPLQQTIFGR